MKWTCECEVVISQYVIDGLSGFQRKSRHQLLGVCSSPAVYLKKIIFQVLVIRLKSLLEDPLSPAGRMLCMAHLAFVGELSWVTVFRSLIVTIAEVYIVQPVRRLVTIPVFMLCCKFYWLSVELIVVYSSQPKFFVLLILFLIFTCFAVLP